MHAYGLLGAAHIAGLVRSAETARALVAGQ
jgi:hypothetical protein